MEAMLAPVDEPLIRALNLDAPCRIADIGCGGGGTALEILRRAPAGSAVHGFDLSPALVELARSRKRSGAGPYRYAEADTLLTLLDRAGCGELDVSDWRGLLPIKIGAKVVSHGR
jgi:SAM-dependent methyltransferase